MNHVITLLELLLGVDYVNKLELTFLAVCESRECRSTTSASVLITCRTLFNTSVYV